MFSNLVYSLPVKSLTHLPSLHGDGDAYTHLSGLMVPLLTPLCFTQHWNALCTQNTSYTFPCWCFNKPAIQATFTRLTQTAPAWSPSGLPPSDSASCPHQTATCLNLHWMHWERQTHALSTVVPKPPEDLINPVLWETNQRQRKVKWFATISSSSQCKPKFHISLS